MDAGYKPAILSRGYGRTRPHSTPLVVCFRGRIVEGVDLAGDEPLMLSRALVEANRGAKDKTLAVIGDLLPPAGSGGVVRPFRLVQ